MLDIKFIRENKELVKQNAINRLVEVDVDKLLKLDEEWRENETKIQALRSERNKGSKSKPSEEEIKIIRKLGDDISKMEKDQELKQLEIKSLLMSVPNLTHPEVKVSGDDSDNPVLEVVGKIPAFSFEPLDHTEIAEKNNLIDFEKASEVTGAKFYYLKNELALLEMALIRYALEVAMKYGYKLMITPDLAKTSIIENMGYNPRGESSQIYNISNSDLSLIGTSEITLGAYHSNEVLETKDLPIKYVGLSHCFRTEAGAYSKFSKGIFRVHQFEKLELFAFAAPEIADKIHHEMLKIEKDIFSGLKIPFRVIDHCTADLGAPSYRTYDLEAWLPGKPNTEGTKGDWAEITSTSNCTDYQARSINVKYIDNKGDKKLVYTFNGTAVAAPRALIAILENYQTKSGAVEIPKVLRKYLPFKKIGK